MHITPVKSTNISGIGYENSVLEVHFASGGIYKYLHVPPDVYSAFLSSPSKGHFHREKIMGHYPFVRLR